MQIPIELPADLTSTVRRALSEDIGSGDLTANLIPADKISAAVVISREPAILCGTAWFDETFRQLDESVQTAWRCQDGDELQQDQTVCEIRGRARSLLSGERTALNFLQLLSGTATTTRHYVNILQGSRSRLLDTRKTVPGLRTAQKYAVLCGGGVNHRLGLYDAILIKENHILAAGGITAAVKQAVSLHRNIEVEVENLEQLHEAIDAGAGRILLDNFTLAAMQEAVTITAGRAELEVSGGVDEDQLAAIATTGVNYISVGALTKHVRAIDFSMRFLQEDK